MDESMYGDFYKYEEEHWWFVARRKIIFTILKRYSPADSPLKILDVGCGTGAILKRLEKYGIAIGVDMSAEAVKFCKLRGCKNVFQASEKNLPFEDNTFNVITILDVIEHIDDDYAALCKYYRLVKKEGILLITTPAYNFLWGPHDVISHHKRRYTAEKLRNRVEEAGFAVERMTYFDTFLFPFIVIGRTRQRLINILGGRSKSASNVKRRSPFVNNLLKFVFSFEAQFLKGFNFKYGVSLLCIAKKHEKEV